MFSGKIYLLFHAYQNNDNFALGRVQQKLEDLKLMDGKYGKIIRNSG